MRKDLEPHSTPATEPPVDRTRPHTEAGPSIRMVEHRPVANLEPGRVAGAAVAVIVAGRDVSFRGSGCAQAVAPARIRRSANFKSRGPRTRRSAPATRGLQGSRRNPSGSVPSAARTGCVLGELRDRCHQRWRDLRSCRRVHAEPAGRRDSLCPKATTRAALSALAETAASRREQQRRRLGERS